eukprot:6396683-Amphidinium_carterae.3
MYGKTICVSRTCRACTCVMYSLQWYPTNSGQTFGATALAADLGIDYSTSAYEPNSSNKPATISLQLKGKHAQHNKRPMVLKPKALPSILASIHKLPKVRKYYGPKSCSGFRGL